MNRPSRHHPMSLPIALTGLALSTWCAVGVCQPSGHPTRKEVRAETLAASRAHLLVPAGEAGLVSYPKQTRSDRTAAQRKTETLAARDAGTLLPAGESSGWKQEREAARARSERTRAQVNAETVQAAKDHKLLPAGEGALVDSAQ